MEFFRSYHNTFSIFSSNNTDSPLSTVSHGFKSSFFFCWAREEKEESTLFHSTITLTGENVDYTYFRVCIGSSLFEVLISTNRRASAVTSKRYVFLKVVNYSIIRVKVYLKLTTFFSPLSTMSFLKISKHFSKNHLPDDIFSPVARANGMSSRE